MCRFSFFSFLSLLIILLRSCSLRSFFSFPFFTIIIIVGQFFCFEAAAEVSRFIIISTTIVIFFFFIRLHYPHRLAPSIVNCSAKKQVFSSFFLLACVCSWIYLLIIRAQGILYCSATRKTFILGEGLPIYLYISRQALTGGKRYRCFY